MATLRTEAIPLANYATGNRVVGPVTVRAADKHIYFEVLRNTTATPTIWPNAATGLRIEFRGSVDGGVSWTALASITSVGGVIFKDKAQTVEAAVTSLKIPLPAARPLQVRFIVDITNGPLRTQGFVELRDGA